MPPKQQQPKGSTAGTNPAPDYKTTMNAIRQLMSARSVPRDPTFLAHKSSALSSSSLPSSSLSTPALLVPTSSSSSLKGGNQEQQQQHQQRLAAQARDRAHEREEEERSLDRLAAMDDNLGVGIFGPGSSSSGGKDLNRREREEKRRRELEDKRLKGRLGLLGGGGIGKQQQQQQQRRGKREESSDDEPGRSGVGRAKKRVRREVDSEEVGDRGDAAEIREPAAVCMPPSDQSVPTADRNNEAEEDDGKISAEIHGSAEELDRITQLHDGDESWQKKRNKKKKKRKSRALAT